MNPNQTANVPTLSGEMTVNETIQRYPRTVEVFNRYGMDSCCGGGLPIAEAAARHGATPEKLLQELEEIARANA